tara:strand:- start:9279 stop:10010 length:732 start_codon:yes stop_codon:yes gene_type:complete
MKRGFVRTLWGEYREEKSFLRRRKMDLDIKWAQTNPLDVEYVTFTFGEDNHKALNDKGIKNTLVDKRPVVWDMDKQQFRHKIEAFKLGMEVFDEMVFLDWDCQPFRSVPENFWEVLGRKESLQAILRMYKRRKATWRRSDQRKIPCASFVYINDKNVPKKLIEKWEELNKPWSEEVVMCRYMEDVMGGWKGVDEYWERFEPDFFVLEEGFVYPKELLATKEHCFRHFNEQSVRRNLLEHKRKK